MSASREISCPSRGKSRCPLTPGHTSLTRRDWLSVAVTSIRDHSVTKSPDVASHVEELGQMTVVTC